MLLNVENLDFAYGTNDIFKNANFRVDKGDHIGLVGRNGSGKSTFVKLLTGHLEVDGGTITTASGLTVGYLEQNFTFNQDQTIYELFLSVFEDIQKKENRLRELETLISSAEGKELESLLKEYGDLQEYFDSNNTYGYKSQIRGMIKGLGFTEEDQNKTFRTLSGGEKTRVSLGMQLLKKPDLLLLDEPTNFLDIPSLTWLEGILKTYTGSFVLISHDRYFLDKVCNRIDEVENFQIKSFKGNYTDYLEQKQKILADQDAHYAKALREYNRQKAIIRRYRDINSKQSSKHARSREIALSKMEVPQKNQSEGTAHFSFEPRVRSGDDVLIVSDLSKNFDDKTLFKDVNFHIQRQDKIGVIGPNGIGKTTLFNILRRLEPKSSGNIRLGSKVIPGWFDQETKDLDFFSDCDLIETIRGNDALMNDAQARNILAAFLFTGEDVFKKIGDLSGGEKARIKLAKLMLSEANFLMMDEPTNHIDMQTKEILENALSAYQGTLLFISHDRYFLNKVANKIYEFTPEGITEYLGNYDDYLRRKEDERERQKNKEKQETPVITKTQRQALRKKEKEQARRLKNAKLRVRQAEKNVELLQEELNKTEVLMSAPGFYDDRENSQKVVDDYNKKKEELDSLMDEWEEAVLVLEELEENS